MAAERPNDTQRKSASQLSITNLTAAPIMKFSGADTR